jgi:hypothetical protein
MIPETRPVLVTAFIAFWNFWQGVKMLFPLRSSSDAGLQRQAIQYPTVRLS